MKTNTLTIQLKQSPQEVFEFALDPRNTSQWVNSIVEEQTNEWPIKNGSVYRNKNREGVWNEYVVSDFIQNKQFVFNLQNNHYHCRYVLTPKENGTELEYHEWVDDGDLDAPFTLEDLRNLKSALDQDQPK